MANGLDFNREIIWFPDALISHRSASELRPTESGNFFLTSNFSKKITDFKGITLNVMEGKPALESDINLGGIYASSEGRRMLENMQISRKKGSESKVFPIEYIEDKLEKMIIREGEEGLNKFRDKAREIASIVPTVYREDYIMSLKKLTNRKDPDAFIRVMDKLQNFSNHIFGENFDELNNYFKATDAYKEPSEGKLKIIDRSISEVIFPPPR